MQVCIPSYLNLTPCAQILFISKADTEDVSITGIMTKAIFVSEKILLNDITSITEGGKFEQAVLRL